MRFARPTRLARAALAALALLPSVIASAADPGAAPAPAAPRGYLGISVQGVKDPAVPPEAGGPWAAAAELILVTPGAAGEAAGFEEGDWILRMDGVAFAEGEKDAAAQFRERLAGRTVGERVAFRVLRRAPETEVLRGGVAAPDRLEILADLPGALAALPEGGSLEIRARNAPRVLDLEAVLGPHPFDRPPVRPVRDDAEIHGALLDRSSPMEEFGRAAVRRFGLEADTADLEGRLREVAKGDDGFRFDDVRFVQRNPWKIGAAAEDLLGAVAPASGGFDLPAILREAAARDRLDLSGARFDPLPRAGTAEDHAEALARVLGESAALVDRAFAGLDDPERETLRKDWAGIGAALTKEGIYLHADPDRARRARNLRLLGIVARVDRAPLYAAALSLARLADPAWLAAVRRDLSADARAGEAVLLRRATPRGEVVLGGRGPNTWREDDPAIVVDLGGDDIWAGAAGSSGPDRPVSAVVDLGGDDAYESTTGASQAAGLLGVGLLVDVSGDDRYIAQDWAQGAGLLGVGALLDLAGRDSYRARHLAQAAGLWGAGILLDRGGDDRYDLLAYGQGLGLPGGWGILRDGAGDDEYYAKGGFPTNYGTRGVFDAWAQGAALGFRLLQSGGIGVLADDGGEDGYEAGSFAQGGGYYFGWGLLHDRGDGDDSYIGSRYNQGFSAHEALGTFFEDGGNDVYTTRHIVIAGLAWDECVTLFEDRGGDDTYRAGGFSLGASAHNSLCFFVDADGADAYEGTAPARAGGNDYHGGTSLSLFLDLGRGRDRWTEGLAAGEIRSAKEHGIAADLPGPPGRVPAAPVPAGRSGP